MTTWLLDGNVLLALTLESHVFHARAERWFASLPSFDRFATCAITEGTLLRLQMRFARDRRAKAAWKVLASIQQHPQHVFWESAPSYETVPHDRLTKPAQLTDAWLGTLARNQGGKVATLDEEFAILHGDVAVLVPVIV
jgi:toxin-antitoxin system PIN domain toxin